MASKSDRVIPPLDEEPSLSDILHRHYAIYAETYALPKVEVPCGGNHALDMPDNKMSVTSKPGMIAFPEKAAS